MDVVERTRALIREPSVSPDPGGAMSLCASWLGDLGFDVSEMSFASAEFPEVKNLYARLGTEGPNFCFAGHTDVVPEGDLAQWVHPPYDGVVDAGNVYGRGAADMKGAIAAFFAATERYLASPGGGHGSISLLLTGDEEGPAVNGTDKVLTWLEERGETLDMCLVGEPTSVQRLGDTAKIGRRGSMQGFVHARGIQGHAAYPERAHNPVPDLINVLHAFEHMVLDTGNAHFQPSNLEVLDLSVGNDRDNVIPGEARGRFNVRFNSDHTSAELIERFEQRARAIADNVTLSWRVSGESFLTPEGALSAAICDAVEEVTGAVPELSTTGGTSDARFIHRMCPVVEFGLVGQSMHKINEHVAVADLHHLVDIYERILRRALRPQR